MIVCNLSEVGVLLIINITISFCFLSISDNERKFVVQCYCSSFLKYSLQSCFSFRKKKILATFFDVNRFNLWFPRHLLDMKTLFSLFADLLRDTVNDGTKIDVFFFTSINCRSASRLPFHQTSSQAAHNSGERGAAPCVHPQ